jgi:hypothetical protein
MVQPPGRYSASWDGRDREAHRVPSGVYFYRLEAPGKVAVEKMVVIR